MHASESPSGGDSAPSSTDSSNSCRSAPHLAVHASSPSPCPRPHPPRSLVTGPPRGAGTPPCAVRRGAPGGGLCTGAG
eukprot:scaffold2560_cov397-Prasinococcus_capsulatus_cf.AAC.5